jgi:hypothetical protein
MSTRWLDIDGMHNVRDLGGVPLVDGETCFGVVVRGETVVHLSAEGAAELRQYGVGRVLDLREKSERLADGDGVLTEAYDRRELVHENVPLAGAPVADDPIGRVLDASTIADRYVHYLGTGGSRLAGAVARAAWDPAAVYVHCAVGKDRTGVVCALLLDLAGAEPDVIVDDYLMTAQRLVPVLSLLGTRPAYAHVAEPDWAAQAPQPDALREFLRRLATMGGARGWLQQHGAEADTLDLLLSRLQGTGAAAKRAV